MIARGMKDLEALYGDCLYDGRRAPDRCSETNILQLRDNLKTYANELANVGKYWDISQDRFNKLSDYFVPSAMHADANQHGWDYDSQAKLQSFSNDAEKILGGEFGNLLVESISVKDGPITNMIFKPTYNQVKYDAEHPFENVVGISLNFASTILPVSDTDHDTKPSLWAAAAQACDLAQSLNENSGRVFLVQDILFYIAQTLKIIENMKI